MENPYIVSTTILYSDGTQTVVNYSQNNDSPAIEQIVAENIERVKTRKPYTRKETVEKKPRKSSTRKLTN